MTLPKMTVVVVATGATAKVFRWMGERETPPIKHFRTLQPHDLDDDGPAGHRPPESTGQQTDEATFAKQLANHLNAKAMDGTYDRIALIADPTTLGTVRPQFHAELEKRLVLQIDKTLTNASSEEIVKAIMAA